MQPQHTGATTHDLTSWGPADLEANQHFAASTNPTAALPGAPVRTAASSSDDEHMPTAPAPADAHQLAA